MSSERGLEATRVIRERISREHGNDPRRLVEFYLEYQERFGSRLRRAPASTEEGAEPAEQGGARDATSPRR